MFSAHFHHIENWLFPEFQIWASVNAAKICYFLNQFIPSIKQISFSKKSNDED